MSGENWMSYAYITDIDNCVNYAYSSRAKVNCNVSEFKFAGMLQNVTVLSQFLRTLKLYYVVKYVHINI